MIDTIKPRFISAIYPVGECPVPLIGESIRQYLGECKSVCVYAATLGEEFDRLLRQLQLVDMARAVTLDLQAGEYLEGATPRGFSPGYGDFPLSLNRDIITVLNATTRIGLCTTADFVLTPQKSVTGIARL
jgi:hypothetical protein